MRAPRAMVPSTSGQGVGRYSYQKAYALTPKAPLKALKQPTIKGEGSSKETFGMSRRERDRPPKTSGALKGLTMWDEYK